MIYDTSITTTIQIRDKHLSLRRDWLHGLWGWAVWHGDQRLGWVVQQWPGIAGKRRWGCVPDAHDDIVYDYDTREDALRGLVS